MMDVASTVTDEQIAHQHYLVLTAAALVTKETGLSYEDICASNPRHQETVYASGVLIGLLRLCGFTVAAVAVAVDKNPDAIRHAHRWRQYDPGPRACAIHGAIDASVERLWPLLLEQIPEPGSYRRLSLRQAFLAIHTALAITPYSTEDQVAVERYLATLFSPKLRNPMPMLPGLRLLALDKSLRRRVITILEQAEKRAYHALLKRAALEFRVQWS